MLVNYWKSALRGVPGIAVSAFVIAAGAVHAGAQDSSNGVPAAIKADAAAAEEEANFPVEAYPRDVAGRIGTHNKRLAKAKLRGPNAVKTRGVYHRPHLWSEIDTKIYVCFFPKRKNFHKVIVKLATDWTRTEAYVPLDFGDPDNPRLCTAENKNREHIRIGFNNKNIIWSAVGVQSVIYDLFPLGKPSMSFDFDDNITTAKLKRIVLHEFGHALGLEHEHQSPLSECDTSAYKLAKLYKFLNKQNSWRPSMVRKKLKILHEKGLIATRFDTDSVMYYAFPRRFYRKSNCYSTPKANLSDVDKETILQMYPKTREERIKLLKTRREIIMAAFEKSGPKTRSALFGLLDIFAPEIKPERPPLK